MLNVAVPEIVLQSSGIVSTVVGVFVFHGFAIAALLAVIGGMLVISDSPAALAVMSVCFFANVVVFLLRLYYPWPYNLYVLAAAWLAIAVTLGVVVAQAVFRRGRVTYQRLRGATLHRLAELLE